MKEFAVQHPLKERHVLKYMIFNYIEKGESRKRTRVGKQRMMMNVSTAYYEVTLKSET